MDLPLEKLAPRAIALVAVGYCVWPSLMAFQTHPEAKPSEKLPEVAAALLKPSTSPPPPRNPFTMRGAESGQLSASRAGKHVGPTTDLLSSLKLEATYIAGGQRRAMINGSLYACQETLLATNSATAPLKLVGVLPYKVLLECDGKTVELTYSNTASPPASSPAATAPAKSGGAGTSRSKLGGKSNNSKT